jgi:hypothetical protein
MKLTFAAILLFALTLILPAVSRAHDDSHDIALDLDIPGKGSWITCDRFAKELYQRMTAAGGEAHYIIYDWRNDTVHFAGRHSFVVYRDKEGRYWGADERQTQPRWLSGHTDAEWTELFASDFETVVVYSHCDARLAGQYADLHRGAPFADPGLIASLPNGNLSTREGSRTASAVPAAKPVRDENRNLYVVSKSRIAPVGEIDVTERRLIRGSLFRVSDTFCVR